MTMPYTVAMSKAHPIAAQVDAKTLADLERLAEHMGCTIDHLVTTAVLRLVNNEIGAIIPDEFAHVPPYRTPELDWQAIDKGQASFDAFLQAGIDDLDAGRTIPHEEVMREIRARVATRQAAE